MRSKILRPHVTEKTILCIIPFKLTEHSFLGLSSMANSRKQRNISIRQTISLMISARMFQVSLSIFAPKGDACFCYCADVLRLTGWSRFQRGMSSKTKIFLRGK